MHFRFDSCCLKTFLYSLCAEFLMGVRSVGVEFEILMYSVRAGISSLNILHLAGIIIKRAWLYFVSVLSARHLPYVFRLDEDLRCIYYLKRYPDLPTLHFFSFTFLHVRVFRLPNATWVISENKMSMVTVQLDFQKRTSVFIDDWCSGCTPLIQSPILYCVKAHMQKRYFFLFKTSWCTKIKHFLED